VTPSRTTRVRRASSFSRPRRGEDRQVQGLLKSEVLVREHQEGYPQPLDNLLLVGGVLAEQPEHLCRVGGSQLLQVVAEVAGFGRAARPPGISSQPAGRSATGGRLGDAGRLWCVDGPVQPS
jgi:hypothetical protein